MKTKKRNAGSVAAIDARIRTQQATNIRQMQRTGSVSQANQKKLRTLYAKRYTAAQGKAAFKAAMSKANAGKLRKVTGSTGWMKADAVRFVKKGGQTQVLIRRNKPRKAAKRKK